MTITSKRYEAVFLDLDNTLYPHDNGMSKAVHQRIIDYLKKKFKLEVTLSPDDYAVKLYRKYGLTVLGLKNEGYEVNFQDYHRYVHNVDLSKFIPQHDPKLVSLCKKLRAQKHMKIYIFTNSDIEHCRRVLNRLGLSESLFDGLICFDSPGIDCKFCKPQRIMYEYAMKVAGIKDPSKCIFVDDNKGNCLGAAKVGWTSVLVTPDTHDNSDELIRIKTIHDLETAVPDLFK